MAHALPAHVRTPSASSLALRSDPRLRMLAARDAFCPPAVLTMLSLDAVPEVRVAAAAHPELPRVSMRRIAMLGTDAGQCEALARNPSATPRVLERLSRHDSPVVRAAVARNPYLDLAVVEDLTADPDQGVRHSAIAALERRA